jgi:Uma2 family endonuclease
MEALATELLVSVDEYLREEEKSEWRHEYLDGTVRAMAGEKVGHNEIVGNLYTRLREHTKKGGGKCRTFIENVKVYPVTGAMNLFYYPDVMVACDPRETDDRYRRFPTVLIEVSSPSTEDRDRGEKLLAYLQSETLQEYLIVQSERPEATMHRRSESWKREDFRGFEAEVEFRSLGLKMTLGEIYSGVLS